MNLKSNFTFFVKLFQLLVAPSVKECFRQSLQCWFEALGAILLPCQSKTLRHNRTLWILNTRERLLLPQQHSCLHLKLIHLLQIYSMLQQLLLPSLFQLKIRNIHEWQLWSLYSSDKRMIQSLQRRHSLPWINLQYLLHKIDEEPNLPPLLYAIFKLWLFRTVSPNVKVLLLQFLNIFVLQQLHEV